MLNLGGIANLTVLDPDPCAVFGFDTAPRTRSWTGWRVGPRERDCDHDGKIAGAGQINEDLVNAHGDRPLPGEGAAQPTGFEMFGDACIARAAGLHGGYDASLMATLTEFTARSVALDFTGSCRSLTKSSQPGVAFAIPCSSSDSASCSRRRSSLRSEELGVPSEAREAMAFAILANEAIDGHATSLPAVTGAAHGVVLGKFCFPPL